MDTQDTILSPHLPEDLIEDIILRLPIKSMLRFECFSKPWRSLISSKRFIKIHLQNSTKNTVIFQCDGRIKLCSLPSVFDSSTNPSSFDDPIINQLKDPSILGCCNGLVCLLDSDKLFFLWNPSTRILKKLPPVHPDNIMWIILTHGLGWDESSDDYKVFVFSWMLDSMDQETFIGKVYSLKTNSWKTIEHMHFPRKVYKGKLWDTVELMYLPLQREVGIYAGGNLHWNRYGNGMEENIVCFDLKTEVCGKIELPSNEGSIFWSELGVIGGCLSSIKFKFLSPTAEVWVMKEYGVKESWSKLVALSHVQELIQPPFSAPFAVGRDGEVLLSFGRFFLVYNPRNCEFRRFRLFNSDREENLCVESLFSSEFS